MVGFSFNDTLVAAQKPINWLLLILVIAETVAQYSLYIKSLSQEFSAKEKYLIEVRGQLLNRTSFIVFGMKICLIVVQCSLIPYLNHLKKLQFIDEAKNLVNSVCNKSFSFFTKLMAPISQFLFCMLAIIFSLVHPSVIFVPIIPIIIMAFFTDHRKKSSCNTFSVMKRLFLFLAIAFTSAFYLYNLIQLHKNDNILSKWREAKQAKDLEW